MAIKNLAVQEMLSSREGQQKAVGRLMLSRVWKIPVAVYASGTVYRAHIDATFVVQRNILGT